MSIVTSVTTGVDKTRRTRLLKFGVLAIVAIVLAISLLDLYCIIDLDGLC